MITKLLAASAVSLGMLAGSALASPEQADLWIGFDGRDDGFLLDTHTGALWMTGACLKPLRPAVRTGEVWVSRTVEMVSVGRAMTTLDQTFALATDSVQPRISVLNPHRGGAMNFPAVVERECAASEACRARARTPECGS